MNYRRRANIVLSLVFLLFILASWAKHLWPENFTLRLCQFVLEASLVGGIADWFAVTALFRKPLGWPYHTALIPRNRSKMIEAIRALVETELLSEAMLRQKIEQLQIADKILQAVENRGGASFLARALDQWLAGLRDRISIEPWATRGAAWIRVKVQELPAAAKTFAYIRSFLDRREFDQWLDGRLEDVLIYASSPRVHTQILTYLENLKEQQLASGGFLQRTLFGVFQAADGVNLVAAADALQTHLILQLRYLKQQDHPLRVRLKSQFKESLAEWERNEITARQIEEEFRRMLVELPLESYLQKGMEQVLADPPSIEPIVNRLWKALQTDDQLQAQINHIFRDMLLQLVQKEHRLIGDIVKETLEGLSDDELNQFIEDKAGNDLQWIRINGSIVGGILGFILFFVLNFGYLPILNVLR